MRQSITQTYARTYTCIIIKYLSRQIITVLFVNQTAFHADYTHPYIIQYNTKQYNAYIQGHLVCMIEVLMLWKLTEPTYRLVSVYTVYKMPCLYMRILHVLSSVFTGKFTMCMAMHGPKKYARKEDGGYAGT